MDNGNSHGSIIRINGTRGYGEQRLYILPDPQAELVLRNEAYWQLQQFSWSDLISLCHLPHGKADTRECFIVENASLRGIVSRRHNTIFFKVVGEGQQTLWAGCIKRSLLIHKVSIND